MMRTCSVMQSSSQEGNSDKVNQYRALDDANLNKTEA